MSFNSFLSLLYLMWFFSVSLVMPLTSYSQTANQDEQQTFLQDNFKRLASIKRTEVPALPFLQLNRQEIANARKRAENIPAFSELKSRYLRIADEWLERDEHFIREIIPPWGSLYVYGLGLNFDPVKRERMQWCGWSDPRRVRATDGTVYPNPAFPDDGTGWKDPQSGEQYYFVAYANGMTMMQLETVDLPALVQAFLLTGDERYAMRALWILDGIASIYPRAYEGPIDYPGNLPGKVGGGRMDRPYYQASRALMNYTYFYEALSLSNYRNAVSPTNPAVSLFRNIEINLLLDGASYCLSETYKNNGSNRELHNGNIDYNRSPLLVGALLGITEWVEWALNGPLGFRSVVANTIDVNGRYYETSPEYAFHTSDLILSSAEILSRMRLPGYPRGFNAFDNERLARFALNFYPGIAIAGHLPLFGDSGPDHRITTNNDSEYDRLTHMNAQKFYYYSDNDAIKKTASGILKSMSLHRPPDQSYTLWELYKGYDDTTDDHVSQAGVSGKSGASTLLFDYGTLILKSGTGAKQRGALMRFGPTLNHGHNDELGLTFYAYGREFSADPGYFNTHFRYGFTTSSIAHNVLVANRKNQLRVPSSGGELISWTDGRMFRSAEVNNPGCYQYEGVNEYRRRIALVDISEEDSYIIDVFWAQGAEVYDYSLHGIFGGKLTVAGDFNVTLADQYKGSVYRKGVDYTSDLDINGRITSFPSAPFTFSPPGGGYGFLQNPSFYRIPDQAAGMSWQSTDGTGHQMHVTHFAPKGSTLITASVDATIGNETANPPVPVKLDYALTHTKVPSHETVRYATVIMPLNGPNRVSVNQLFPENGPSGTTIGLEIIPDSSTTKHFYFTSTLDSVSYRFRNGWQIRGREVFIARDSINKTFLVSITGEGEVICNDFNLITMPLVTKPLIIKEVQSNPLRIRVELGHRDAQKLVGNVLKVSREQLSRPYSLKVISVQRSTVRGEVWLVFDAIDPVQSVGKVDSYEPHHYKILTSSRFPRVRSYTYGLDPLRQGETVKYNPYNGYFNGFWLKNKRTGKQSLIRDIQQDNSEIILDTGDQIGFDPGDEFEICLLTSGDQIEIPVWAQIELRQGRVIRQEGPAKITVFHTDL